MEEIVEGWGAVGDSVGVDAFVDAGAAGGVWSRVAGYLGRKLAGLQLKEIARHFHREPMTVSLGVRKIEDLIRQDPEMAQRVEATEKELSKGRKRKYFITIA